MSAKRFREQPFGGIAQDELAYLRAVAAPPAAILVLVVLRVRAGGSAVVIDGVASLASWSCLSPRTAKRALGWLRDHELILWGARRSLPGGQPGQWGRAIRIIATSSWPRWKELRATQAQSTTGHIGPKPDRAMGHDAGALGQTDPSFGPPHEGLPRDVPDLDIPEAARSSSQDAGEDAGALRPIGARRVRCGCGESALEHVDDAGRCLRPGCGCRRYAAAGAAQQAAGAAFRDDMGGNGR